MSAFGDYEYVSDCCGEFVKFWDENDTPICPGCGKVCEPSKVLVLTEDDIRLRRAERRADR